MTAREAAENWREINGGGVSAEDGRGEWLTVEPVVKGQMAECVEDRDALDAARQEKILHHVEHEQRLHAVVGEAFPGFREREIPEAARVAEETGLVFFPAERDGIIGLGGRGHGRMVK